MSHTEEDATLQNTLLSQIQSLTSAKSILRNLLQRQILSLPELQTSIQQTTTHPKRSNNKSQEEKRNKLLSTCRMRHIALRISYDGSNYDGYAENVGSPTDNSIEHHLFHALQKTCLVKDRFSCDYSRCGRTDKGVSAFGQVIGLKVRSCIPSNARKENLEEVLRDEDLPKNSYETISFVVSTKQHQSSSSPETKVLREINYPQILNAVLPPEIRVLGWCPVTNEFSARFSAKDRTYRYFFALPRGSNDASSIGDMREGLNILKGKHDFRNLCKMDPTQVYNFEREIYEASIVPSSSLQTTTTTTTTTSSGKERQMYYFQIRGQAFLWHQIRCIVAVAMLIGRKLESPQVFRQLLDVQTNPGKPSYEMAQELPLVLHDCSFRNLKLGYSCRALFDVMCVWEERWNGFMIQAEKIRDAMESLNECEMSLDDLREFWVEIVKEKSKKMKKKKGCVEEDGGIRKLEDAIQQSREQNGDIVSWKEALRILKESVAFEPSSNAKEPLHVPLIKRSRGTTYEEKVRAMKGKRKDRYEENVIKKRKTTEEDQKFYEHMAQQGGTGI